MQTGDTKQTQAYVYILYQIVVHCSSLLSKSGIRCYSNEGAWAARLTSHLGIVCVGAIMEYRHRFVDIALKDVYTQVGEYIHVLIP